VRERYIGRTYKVKTCTHCNQELPLDAFYKGSSYKDGVRPRCKQCMSLLDYQRNRDRKLDLARVYRETHKEQAQEYAVEYRKENPDKLREVQQRHYAANRDKKRADVKQYRLANPEIYTLYGQKRRAKMAGCEYKLTAEQWREIQARFKYRCAYCNERSARLTMDHVVPISKGGAHSADNIVPACKTCNCSKQASPAPFYVQTMLIA
jgi:5-methylcytosine-specific restriction endonuclease McrA